MLWPNNNEWPAIHGTGRVVEYLFTYLQVRKLAEVMKDVV